MKDLEANQDYEPPENFDREAIRTRIGLPADDVSEAVHSSSEAVSNLDVHPELQVGLFAAETDDVSTRRT